MIQNQSNRRKIFRSNPKQHHKFYCHSFSNFSNHWLIQKFKQLKHSPKILRYNLNQDRYLWALKVGTIVLMHLFLHLQLQNIKSISLNRSFRSFVVLISINQKLKPERKPNHLPTKDLAIQIQSVSTNWWFQNRFVMITK